MAERNLIQITTIVREAVQDIASTPAPAGDEAFHRSDLIQDLGCDSLDMVNMLFQMEEQFNLTVPEPDIDEFKLSKVGNLVAYIEKRAG